MGVTKREFGKLKDGTVVDVYTITNHSGARVSLQTLGAGIQSLLVPDKNGKLSDVVLGFKDPNMYLEDTGYQGLVVGRYANRIRDGKFTVDGVEYHTPQNQGTWTLHGGGRISHSVWIPREHLFTDNSVTFFISSPDGEDGFPGEFRFFVTYTFTEDNTLRIEYKIQSDKNTIANPTNHAYFNLSGNPYETIDDHYLQIMADFYTFTDESQLTTGRICRLENTSMDFNMMTRIGAYIDYPNPVVIEDVGYDNNYCLSKSDPNNPFKFDKAATLYHRGSGRQMDVFTDMPGMQLYCSGWLPKEGYKGKKNGRVAYRRGVAMETQFWPDSCNYPDSFPSRFVKAYEDFYSKTEYRFSVKK